MPANPRRVALMLDLVWPYKWHTGIFTGVQRYALGQGWESEIDEYVDDTLPTQKTKSLPYDGVIARATRNVAERCEHLGIPLVNVWLSSPVWKSLPGVFPDYAAAGRLRAEHLLDRGVRNFSVVLARGNRAHDVECREFRRLVEEAGYCCTVATVPLAQAKTLANWRKSKREIAAWMEGWRPPVGVYVGPHEASRLVVQLCRQRGWRIPDDVAIITGLNEEIICESLRPTLSSVELGYERVGYEAARMLDGLMERKRSRKKVAPPEHILIPPQNLVVRESTDFFAINDPLVASALQFISANSHRRIGPSDVARAVGAEARTLQNRFHKFLGRPIATEIRRVRIERAKRELTQSQRRLDDIARDVGFSSSMRLYEVFRRELGVTPGEYRRQRQQKDGM